jgi:hypothetical protein
MHRLKQAGIQVRDDGVQHDYMHHKVRAHGTCCIHTASLSVPPLESPAPQLLRALRWADTVGTST